MRCLLPASAIVLPFCAAISAACAAEFSGDQIATDNAGTIQGQGSIFNPVQNSGLVTPLGGQLTFEGGGNSNAAGAIIELAAATSILFTQGSCLIQA